MLVIAGVVGQSAVIDELARAGKIDVSGSCRAVGGVSADRRRQPFPNVPRALVIAGSDRRGAVFGLYDLSEKIGVSPWYWFADVPVAARRMSISPPARAAISPRSAIAASSSTTKRRRSPPGSGKQFGGAELARCTRTCSNCCCALKGNYLWPAMWQPRAFNDDDPQNMVLADAMGVVMGTSHHEPMTRAQPNGIATRSRASPAASGTSRPTATTCASSGAAASNA